MQSLMVLQSLSSLPQKVIIATITTIVPELLQLEELLEWFVAKTKKMPEVIVLELLVIFKARTILSQAQLDF